MKALALLSTLLFASLSYAEFKIISISAPHEFLDEHISLFLDNGEIVHINQAKELELDLIRNSFTDDSFIIDKETNFDNKADIISGISKVPKLNIIFNPSLSTNKEMFTPEKFSEINFTTLDPLEKSNITRLNTYEEAQALMETFNGKTRLKSQCYNRAHMWAYESLVNNNVNLGKVWIFFTRKYIREFRYKWWFHVAPYTRVKDQNDKYVVDRGFTMVPYNMENWKNIFMENKATCPVIKKYNDYANYQEDAYCYLLFSSQYYWQPFQIKNLSNEGEHTWGYKDFELKRTYRNALGIWSTNYPRLETSSRTSTRPATTTRPTTNSSYKRKLQVGEYAYNIKKENAKVKIIGKANDGTYSVHFLDGPYQGQLGNNWGRHVLAITNSCAHGFCSGSTVYNKEHDADVKILATQLNGQFVIEFLNGPNSGRRGHSWEATSLSHK